MSEHYRMVFINGILCLILITGFLIYRFKFPKKRINYFILLLLVSLLPVISIFRPGAYESGDFTIHVYRSIEFYSILKEGNIMPSWAGNLNANYGYPIFIFLNPLPYYAMSFFHFLGFSFINSMKVLLAVSFISSGIFFYLWAKREVKISLAAFTGAIVYLFTPYHLVDLHFRVDIGEVMAFASLPLFFWALSKFQEEKNALWFLISGVAFSLLMFSHQAMALFSLSLIVPYVAYAAFQSRRFFKNIALYFSILALGFIHSFYSWISHIIIAQYTLAYQIANQTVVFPNFTELIYSPWRYGFLFQGHKGEASYLIGYSQIIILLTAIFLIAGKKLSKHFADHLLMWVIISSFLIFMMTPVSSLVWNTFPILNTAQFSTRFLLLLAFAIASITLHLAFFLKKNTFIISVFLLLTVGYTMLNWGHRRVIPAITDSALISNLPKSTAEGEGFCCMGQPRWTLAKVRWMDAVPDSTFKILEGKGELKAILRTTTEHSYLSFSKENLSIQENTWYFPGWELYIDNQTAELGYTRGIDPGIISFSVPSGLHKIDLIYKDLPYFFIAKVISVLTLLTSLIFIIFLLLRKVFMNRLSYIPHLLFGHSYKKRKGKS